MAERPTLLGSRLSVVRRSVAASGRNGAPPDSLGVVVVAFTKTRRRLKRISVCGWVAFVPLVALSIEPSSVWRLPAIVFGVAMVGVSMLWVQVCLLGDYLAAYTLGFHDGSSSRGPEPGKRDDMGRHLSVVGE